MAGACTGDLTSYSYDAQDQLIQIDFPDLTVATYRYDGLGRRIEKDVDGTVTKYVSDGSDILLEYDGVDVLQARYSNGDRIDQPLALETAGQSYFYQADHQGSVRQLTDSLGAVANSYTYDSYGRIETSSETIPNPYLYTAREFDAESGLYYYRARYYDPELGRFLKEDPIGFAAGDANLYRYVFNNPVNLNDPDGLRGSGCCLIPGKGWVPASKTTPGTSGVPQSGPKFPPQQTNPTAPPAPGNALPQPKPKEPPANPEDDPCPPTTEDDNKEAPEAGGSKKPPEEGGGGGGDGCAERAAALKAAKGVLQQSKDLGLIDYFVYLGQVGELNIRIGVHNMLCPQHQVDGMEPR